MTFDEFNEFWIYHSVGFTGLIGWLDKTTKGSDAPTARDIKKRWFGVLASLRLEDAKKASDKLISGEVDEPKGFDRHPAAIRKIALGMQANRPKFRRQPRIVDGEYVYRCLQCRDEGLMFCWHTASMKAAKDGTISDPGKALRCVVRCTCSEGDLYQNKFPCLYDPKIWLPVENTKSAEEQQSLIDFVANIHPANYEPDFAQYG